uniref:Uncharacterized protein n=1 Tax=Arundo donax TaxID=35708 RepID=A0A0A9DG74_ARUDO
MDSKWRGTGRVVLYRAEEDGPAEQDDVAGLVERARPEVPRAAQRPRSKEAGTPRMARRRRQRHVAARVRFHLTRAFFAVNTGGGRRTCTRAGTRWGWQPASGEDIEGGGRTSAVSPSKPALGLPIGHRAIQARRRRHALPRA